MCIPPQTIAWLIALHLHHIAPPLHHIALHLHPIAPPLHHIAPPLHHIAPPLLPIATPLLLMGQHRLFINPRLTYHSMGDSMICCQLLVQRIQDIYKCNNDMSTIYNTCTCTRYTQYTQ